MSFEDPFIAVQNEIISSIDKTRINYKNWLELREILNQENHENKKEIKVEFDEKTLELRNQIRSLDWDVEDMEGTFEMYESYPKKMKLSKQELKNREQFIIETKDELKLIKNDVFDTKYNIKENTIVNLINNPIGYYSFTFDGNSTNKYKRLDDESSNENNNNHSAIDIDVDTLKDKNPNLIPYNDLRLAKEIEQMIEEENTDFNYDFDNSDYVSNYSQKEPVYRPTFNTINNKYDSRLKKVARAFQSISSLKQQGIFATLVLIPIIIIFLFFF